MSARELMMIFFWSPMLGGIVLSFYEVVRSYSYFCFDLVQSRNLIRSVCGERGCESVSANFCWNVFAQAAKF